MMRKFVASGIAIWMTVLGGEITITLGRKMEKAAESGRLGRNNMYNQMESKSAKQNRILMKRLATRGRIQGKIEKETE